MTRATGKERVFLWDTRSPSRRRPRGDIREAFARPARAPEVRALTQLSYRGKKKRIVVDSVTRATGKERVFLWGTRSPSGRRPRGDIREAFARPARAPEVRALTQLSYRGKKKRIVVIWARDASRERVTLT